MGRTVLPRRRVLAAGFARLEDGDLDEIRQARRELVPNPSREDLARWVLETGDVVEVSMIEAFVAMAVSLPLASSVSGSRAWVRVKPSCMLATYRSLLLLASPARSDCRNFLLAAQSSEGGWGAHRMAPAEAFDTAVALLALRGLGEPVARGRTFLFATQQADGAWPETTRPSGGRSYAQRISTLSVAAKKGTILAAMAVTGPQPSNWSLSLLIGRLVQNGPESVKGAPLLGAAKRTLDGEDRSEIVT